MITLQPTIHQRSITLFPNPFPRNLRVHPVREPPHGRIDLAELDAGLGMILHGLHEGIVEVAVVEEDVWVVIPSIEVALEGAHGLDDTIEFLVAREDDDGGVGAGAGGVDGETACREDFIVSFADSSGERKKGKRKYKSI